MNWNNKILISLISLLTVSVVLPAQDHYDISNLSVNTSSMELAPAFYDGGLVFCSNRKSDIFISNTGMDDNPLSNLYYSELKRSGKFESPRLFSKELTTKLYEGSATFSKDGKTIYFTRNIDASWSLWSRQLEDTTFGIFTATLNDDRWINISQFRYNDPSYNTGYPSLSDDGTRLFYCMDAPGGSGGFDIYVSKRENGQWSNPENLGDIINTEKNEISPFIHSSGRLYFASRGHGQGDDMDIYYTVEINGEWQPPVALSAPINSGKDDYGLIMNVREDTCYFASDREGSVDIFSAYSVYPTFSDCPAQQVNDYCFVFYEPYNNEVDTTAFAYEWDLGDGTVIRSLEAEHCFAQPGNYHIELNLIDKLTNEVLMAQATYDFLIEPIEQAYITAPDTVRVGQQIELDGDQTFLKNFRIDGYFWDFNDGFRENGSSAQHTYLFPGNYLLQLGVLQESDDKEIPDQKQCVARRIVVIQ